MKSMKKALNNMNALAEAMRFLNLVHSIPPLSLAYLKRALQLTSNLPSGYSFLLRVESKGQIGQKPCKSMILASKVLLLGVPRI